MNRIEPKRAGMTRESMIKKIRAYRWKLHGKTVEEIGLIEGDSTRQVRTRLDYVKDALGVICDATMTHALHTLGLVYTCKHEAVDWLEQHHLIRFDKAA